MCDKDSKMEMKRQIFVSLPSLHQYHLQGEVAEISLPVDKRVVEKIEEYVSEGFLSSSLIRSLLEQFVKKEIFVGERCPSWTNRRFFPSQRDISNFIYTSKMKALKSKYDQENLEASLAEWARDRPQDRFEFSATDLYKDDTETETTAGFFFLYQSSWQRRLLNLYGNEICFLDATYRTTKYSIPLFFLCVKTNIDYSVVAVFACQFENTRSIVRAISKIKEWNPEWNPKYFMVDHCEAEINAISTCFPGPDCQIFICDFHREQAWSRWLKATKHGLNKNMEDVLCMLRRIARAPTKVEFDDALSNLKEGSTWKNHKEFRNWFNNTWLKNVTMWAWLYRKDRLLVNINTNNGVERQNRTFKYDYLQKFIDRTLTGMLTTVITGFLPDQYKKYLDVNVKASQFYKQYNTNLPAFLHNRPKHFIDHCRKRILPAEEVLGKIEKKGDCLFTVESLTDQISTYDVFIGNDNDAPACKCEDWNRSHWPCKHLLAVVMHFPGSSWDDLPAHYRNNPMFVLDQKCILDIGFKVPSDSDDLPISDPDTATPLVSFDDIKPVTTDSSVKIKTAEDQNLSSKIREQLEEIKGFTYLEVPIDIQRKAFEELKIIKELLYQAVPVESDLPILDSTASVKFSVNAPFNITKRKSKLALKKTSSETKKYKELPQRIKRKAVKRNYQKIQSNEDAEPQHFINGIMDELISGTKCLEETNKCEKDDALKNSCKKESFVEEKIVSTVNEGHLILEKDPKRTSENVQKEMLKLINVLKQSGLEKDHCEKIAVAKNVEDSFMEELREEGLLKTSIYMLKKTKTSDMMFVGKYLKDEI